MRGHGAAAVRLAGATPAQRIWTHRPHLRPEGKQGPLSRSLVDGYAAYLDRWAQTGSARRWPGAPVAGDPEWRRVHGPAGGGRVGAGSPRSRARDPADEGSDRAGAHPAGEDPEFHLKLGRGSLSDVEWTVQLLQLRSGIGRRRPWVRFTALEAADALEAEDAECCGPYRFCERTRNRWWLVGSAPAAPRRAAPAARRPVAPGAFARHDGPELREDYRRVTRRARRVVERLFYGTS